MRLTSAILDRAAECPAAAGFMVEYQRAEETVGAWINRVFEEAMWAMLDAYEESREEGDVDDDPVEDTEFLSHVGSKVIHGHFQGSPSGAHAMVAEEGRTIRNLSGRGVEKSIEAVYNCLAGMVDSLAQQVVAIAARHPGDVHFGWNDKWRFGSAAGMTQEFQARAAAFTDDTKDIYIIGPISRTGSEALLVEGFGPVLTAGLLGCWSVHGIGILRTMGGGVTEVDRTVTVKEHSEAIRAATFYEDAIHRKIRGFQCVTLRGKCEFQSVCRKHEQVTERLPATKLIKREGSK